MEVPAITGPSTPGDYRLRVWLEDQVGFTGPAAVAQIPHDTTPPAAPQELSVAAPQASRQAQGFDLRWRDIADAGSPIDAAHYEVLDGSGKTVVPTQTVAGENIQSVADLDAPDAAGTYTLRLWLSDAEGNVGAPVTASLAYDCVRSASAGGQSLSAGIGDGGVSSAVVDEGQGTTLAGALGGQGSLGAAPVCVFSNVLGDSHRDFLGIALTGRDGGYRFAVGAGPSRQLSAVYRLDQRQLSAEALVQTTVHPTFFVARKVVHNKGYARFYGQIPGPDNGGVVVVLQVKSGKGWRVFRRYATNPDGSFELRYRSHTATPTTYVMRAQVRGKVGYPYLPGNSRERAVRVMP